MLDSHSASFGIGLRTEHIAEFYSRQILPSPPDFLEIHAENFLDLGSPRTQALFKIREDYPISCHAVGLSLGSAEGIDKKHLQKIMALVQELQPMLFSDHVSWSVSGGKYLNDLMPQPLTQESIEVLCANIATVQDSLGRKMLVENPSSYISFGADEMSEAEFMQQVAQKSGCGILLDLNNIYVSAENHGFSVADYLDKLQACHIGEIHLAGHVKEEVDGKLLRIDTHNRPVDEVVWEIFKNYASQNNLPPVLVEWDSELPALPVLLQECDKARAVAA